jgi:hypothetical protein
MENHELEILLGDLELDRVEFNTKTANTNKRNSRSIKQK